MRTAILDPIVVFVVFVVVGMPGAVQIVFVDVCADVTPEISAGILIETENGYRRRCAHR